MHGPVILTSCISSTRRLISELRVKSFEVLMPEKNMIKIDTRPNNKNILLLFPEIILKSKANGNHKLQEIFFDILSTKTSKTMIILTAQLDWLKEYVDFTHIVKNENDPNKLTPCPLFIIKFMNFHSLFMPINEYLVSQKKAQIEYISIPFSFIGLNDPRVTSTTPLCLERLPKLILRELTCSAVIFMKYIMYRYFLPRENIDRGNSHKKKLIPGPTYNRESSVAKWEKHTCYILWRSIFRKK